MKFELWSIWHFLYIASPFLIFAGLYGLVKNRSQRVKDGLGYLLGIISVLILVVRNADIFLRNGWDLEVIPLQVCHIGSIIAGLALLLKKNWVTLTAFCFNTIPAFLAMVFADSLANYDTLLKIRPQTYIWGHIFIIVCALYALLVHLPALDRKDLRKSLCFFGIMACCAILCNSLFRAAFAWEPNYFYMFNYDGTPLKFLYTVFPTSVYGWFQINWFYTGVLLAAFLCAFLGMYVFGKFLVKKVSDVKCAVKPVF